MEANKLPKGFVIPEGWEVKFHGFEQKATNDNEDEIIVIRKKKPKYPKYVNDCKNPATTTFNDSLGALKSLLILRDEYRRIANGGKEWAPNWNDNDQKKYGIMIYISTWEWYKIFNDPHIFSFPTRESAELFLKNFKDTLLKEVKPLFIK